MCYTHSNKGKLARAKTAPTQRNHGGSGRVNHRTHSGLTAKMASTATKPENNVARKAKLNRLSRSKARLPSENLSRARRTLA